jgi:hypothetical protein
MGPERALVSLQGPTIRKSPITREKRRQHLFIPNGKSLSIIPTASKIVKVLHLLLNANRGFSPKASAVNSEVIAIG